MVSLFNRYFFYFGCQNLASYYPGPVTLSTPDPASLKRTQESLIKDLK